MKGNLVEKLTDFGLSINQAKVYLSIVQSTATNVNAISKTTHLHPQDIYKILPKLEEKGLITQTVNRPVTIEAIPVEQTLSHLVNIEQQKAKHRIKRLKSAVKTLATAIEDNKKAVEITTPKQNINITFLSTDRTIKNKLDASHKNAKTKCDVVLNFELLTRTQPHLRKRFQALSENKVKTRILLDIPKNQDFVESTLEEIMPNTGDFTVKLTSGKITVKPYVIIDCEEIYISTQKKTPLYLPCVLWTNCQDIIQIYEDNFEIVWNSSSAVAVRPTKTQRRRELH